MRNMLAGENTRGVVRKCRAPTSIGASSTIEAPLDRWSRRGFALGTLLGIHLCLAMVAISEALLETALTLEPDERAELANKILSSLDDEEEGVEQAWCEEITRRAREVRAGRVDLVDGPSSLRAIRERLQRQ